MSISELLELFREKLTDDLANISTVNRYVKNVKAVLLILTYTESDALENKSQLLNEIVSFRSNFRSRIEDIDHPFSASDIDDGFVTTPLNKFSSFLTELISIDSESNQNQHAEHRNLNSRNNEDIGAATNIVSKNVILYGPPGTGKTYHTVIYSVAIAESKEVQAVADEAKDDYKKIHKRFNELKSQGRIAFTTFHQSYSYEEFIEGIRPRLSQEANGDISYELHDGVFKEFCKKADGTFKTKQRKTRTFDESYNKLLEQFANTDEIEIPLISGQGVAKISKQSRGDGFNIDREGVTTNKQQLLNVYMGELGIPSGAFDNYRKAIIAYMEKSCGLQGYKIEDIVSEQNNAEGGIVQNYVFIIDEINRGSISKIFGEIITLIEDTKRLGEDESANAILPYSVKPFGVPNNVYIIGTMNTADRSIALIDTALRRRFDFIEMQPDASLLSDVFVGEVSIEKLLLNMNKRICTLLDREHTIGHAYFLPLKNNSTIDNLASIMKNKIIPLLQEYFYDDYEKIRLILADNREETDEKYQLIKKLDIEQDLFGDDIDYELVDQYVINDNAFIEVQSYAKI